MENYDRKKIIQILSKDVFVDKLANPIEALADYLIDNGVTFKTKEIITNFDRIKSMSVEDLTKFISNITKVVAIKLGNDYVVNDKQFIQQWLLQEVSENEQNTTI